MTVGTNADAIRWVRASTLPDDDRAELLYHVAKFPGLAFAREHGEAVGDLEREHRLSFPEWFRVLLATLTGPAGTTDDRGDRSVRFDGDYYYDDDMGPGLARDELPKPWYGLFMAGYSNDEDRETMYGDAGVYPVGQVFAENRYLAVDIRDPTDRWVYRFHLEDLWDDRYAGRPVRDSLFPVFASYPEMLARIDDIRWLDGTVVSADPVGVAAHVLDVQRDGGEELRRTHELLAAGDRDAATASWRALAAGSVRSAVPAMVLLSVAAETTGDEEQAESWWRRAAEHDPDRAAAPLLTLGANAKTRRDRAGAERWLRRVAGGGYGQAALAAGHLGELCFWMDDLDDALAWYGRCLAGTDDLELIAEAAQRSGEILAGRGDHEAAAPLLRRARDTGRLTLVDGVAVFI
jgi:tetratricopeptide (TPR) repeat protein